MRKFLRVIWLPVIICLLCYFAYWPVTAWMAERLNFSNTSPEELFRRTVLDIPDQEIPSTVTQLQGLEGLTLTSGVSGPVYLRFKSNSSLIEEILKQDHPYYGSYSEISCADFLKAASSPYHIQDYPEKFTWWKPLEITAPVCYRTKGQVKDAKYLLIDYSSDEVYFYRTFTPVVETY